MNIFAQQDLSPGFATIVFFAFGTCIIAWAVLVERCFKGTPILPYQPRRQVPWRVWDLLAVLFFYFVLSVVVIHIALYFYGLEINESPERISIKKITDHPILQLLAARNWTAIILCSVAGIVVAPIIEEMFFRVLLQGWLEKVDRNWRRRAPILRRVMPMAAMPILISSLIFAGQHFRFATPPQDARLLILLFVCDSFVKILSLIFVMVLLYWRVGAKAVDLGWEPKKIGSDIGLGLIAFLAIAVPIYAMQLYLPQLLPKDFAPDPIPIFFFAIALGFLYHRTHRAAPPIALHMALNASSLAMALISLAG